MFHVKPFHRVYKYKIINSKHRINRDECNKNYLKIFGRLINYIKQENGGLPVYIKFQKNI